MTTVDRLIKYFAPDHYELTLTLARTERRFEGTVTITGNTTNDNSPIKLHAKDLEITAVVVDDRPAKHSMGEHDELTLTATDLPAGEHTVSVTFNGTITDHMHGLYPCYYEHDGDKKELLATQFESHHAREVFPCIDEPAAKATFALQLLTEPDQTVLSNMPVKLQSTNGNHLVTDFDTTPRMSTYLLAFVVGELHKKSAKTRGNVEINIYATHAQPPESLDFALEVATRGIDFYEDYYQTKYPLPKSDHVALPDFSSGAMENWGLITYRETALLADPKNTSIASRRRIAKVILHEEAHQWFGNLVTMKWWNDLWLNESFANEMEYLAADNLYPEWNNWLDFSINEPPLALERDATDGVQPVQVDVRHPDEISTLFDPAIVYAKGSRLIRMIQQYIGDDAFRAGLKQYFADHKYDNTVGDDLWNALETASGKKIKSIMNAWISQPGYPVVTVTRENGHITLSQQQFFIGPHDESDRLWPIPLDASDNGAPQLFDSREISWPSNDPIRLNRNDSAHFITHYDNLSRQALIDQVKDGSLDAVGRIQLLHEATLLAQGGVMSSDQLIPLIEAYENETLKPVWNVVAGAMGELRKFVEYDKEAEMKLRRLSAQVARKQYERLGWDSKEGEPEEDTEIRRIVIGMTLYGETPEALAKAKELYDNTPLEQLDPELRSLIISSVARFGDGKIVDDLIAAYSKTQSPHLKRDIALGVTSTRVPEKITKLLASMKDPQIVKPQDVFFWYAYLVTGRDSREQAWQWTRDNWDWIEETFAGDKSYDSFPQYAANALRTPQQLDEYKEFFEPKKNIVALNRVITMGVTEIKGRVELIERDKDAVINALKAYKFD